MMEVFWKVMDAVDIVRMIQEYVNLRNFFATSKALTQVKHSCYYWKLTIGASVKFYNNTIFRDTLYHLLLEPNKQLSLNLTDCRNITDVSDLEEQVEEDIDIQPWTFLKKAFWF